MAGRRRGISAWLVTWEWTSDSASVVDRIAAVISPRKSPETVAAFVEWYYALGSSTVAELVSYARNRKNNPYQAKKEIINSMTHGDRITCGHHPWLYARKVKSLTVDIQPDAGVERISWIEPDSYRLRGDESGIELAQPGVPDSEARVVQGPLSAQRVWTGR